MNRRLLVFGIALVGAGLLVGAAQTGAFDRVSADRDVSVSIADDSEAYLASEVTYDGSNVSNYGCFLGWICWENNQPQNAVELENRYVEGLSNVDVTVVQVSGAPNNTLQVSAAPTQLQAGDFGEVQLECGDLTDSGTVDVTLEIEASAPIEIHGATRQIDGVAYDCDPSPND